MSKTPLSGSVTVKGLIIAGLILILLAPLSMLRSLVSERTAMRERAYAKVAQGWGGAVVVGGPMLIVPTERTIIERGEARTERCNVYLLPAQLKADSTIALEAEPRRVGLYAAPVYLSRVRLSGEFDFSALKPLERPGVSYRWEAAKLRLPIGNVSGLREISVAQFEQAKLKFGPATPGAYTGVEAMIDLSALMREQPASFDFELSLAGSREWSFLPTGAVTQVDLRANWPHPAFQGAFLPVRRVIDEESFNASWQVLELNRGYGQSWIDGEVGESALLSSAFGASLHQPVDVYQRGERAVKYALVFIALTFLTFFAWEQLSQLRLHPLQYLLVGLALSTFYLLLIALSEHIAFAAAYAIAAAALTALLGVYVAGVLGGKAGLLVSGALALVYSVLYVLVLSEDFALLLGALTVFVALAGLMLATRRVDWYGVGVQERAS